MINLKGFKYTPELRGNSTKNYPEGNVFNKITARIPFSASIVLQATTSSSIEFYPSTGGYSSPNQVIRVNSGLGANPFIEFNVGDLIEIQGSASNDISGLVITEIIGTNAIRVLGALTAEVSTACKVVNISPILACNYFFNLIENGEPVNYISKIDGVSTQLAKAVVGAAGDTDFEFQAPAQWHLGSATLTYVGYDSDNCRHNFEITHEIFISPLYLPGSHATISAGDREAYYNALSCLKHIGKVELFFDPNNPNRKQVVSFSETLGNTGGRSENFNTGSTNYTIENVVLTDFADEAIASVELPTAYRESLMTTAGATKQTGFSFSIKNTTDSPFKEAANFIKVILNFLLEIEPTEFTSTNTVKQNMIFDRATVEAGESAIDGENVGTLEQVFKDCAVSRVDNTEITVTGKILMTSAQMERVRTLATAKYELNVDVFVANGQGGDYNGDYNEDYYNAAPAHGTSDSADTATLPISIASFLKTTHDPDLIEITTTLAEHPDEDAEKTETEAFPGDEIVFKSLIDIDTNGRDLAQITFQQLRCRIVAEKNDGSIFDLDSFILPLAPTPKVDDLAVLGLTMDRPFVLPAGDYHRQISVSGSEETGADTGIFRYEVLFPVLFRWEYWQQLLSAHSDFYNISLPQNGKNHFWFHFKNSDWEVKYKIELDVMNQGVIGPPYSDSITLTPKDYESNDDWSEKNVKTYDIADTELTDSVNRFVLGYADTKVVATFEKDTALDMDKIAAVIWMEVYEGGGRTSRVRISSVYEVGAESWFKSSDNSNKVVLANPSGNVVTATALIDYTKLPAGVTSFRIYGRIYNSAEASEGDEYDGEFVNGSFDLALGDWTQTSNGHANWEWTPTSLSPGYAQFKPKAGDKSMTAGESSSVTGHVSTPIPAGSTLTIPFVTFSFPVIDIIGEEAPFKFKLKIGGNYSNESVYSGSGYPDFVITTGAETDEVELIIISTDTYSDAEMTAADTGGNVALSEISIEEGGIAPIGSGGEETLSDAMILIPSNPAKERRSENTAYERGCPYNYIALAQTVGSDEDKNDKHSVHFWGIPGISGLTMILQKQTVDGSCDDEDWEQIALLTDNTFGTCFGYGFLIDDWGKKYAGYLLDFQKLIQHVDGGVGRYRVIAHKTPIVGAEFDEPYPIEFCLMEYRDYLAEGTVIIRTLTSGLHGKKEAPEHAFLYGTDWVNYWRLRGVFGYDRHPLTAEKTEYTNRQLSQFKKTFGSLFTLKLKKFPGWLHNLVFSEVAQATVTTISDFNRHNAMPHDQTSVLIAGGYEPVHREKLNKELTIDIEFETDKNNQDHRIC